MTNIRGKIIYGRPEDGKMVGRGVADFLRVKNGLSRFPTKLWALKKKLYGNNVENKTVYKFCIETFFT